MFGRPALLKNQTLNYLPLCCKMSKQKSQKGRQCDQKPEQNIGPISLTKEGNVSIKILAKPGAKTNNITDISSEGVGVQISAPPVDGEANTELVKYLAGVFGLRKSEVSLQKGSKSRQKTIILQFNTLTMSQVEDKLNAALQER